MSSPAATVASASTPERVRSDSSEKASLLRSSAIVGASSGVNIAVGLVRAKVVAALIGPAGVGLLGVYTSLAELVAGTIGGGLQSSGVRQVAEAAAQADAARLVRVVAAVRAVSLVLALAGGSALALASGWIADFTFGNRHESTGIVLLSVAVVLRIVAAGEASLIQGLRRVADFGRLTILSSATGSLAAIGVLLAWRTDGIVVSIGAAALLLFGATLLYSRSIPHGGWENVGTLLPAAMQVLKTGGTFVASGALMLGSGYVVRTIVLRNLGMEGAGLYHAAWVLAGMYVNFILQAMGTDFFPRLTEVASDHTRSNRLVNEQTSIGLLFGVPGTLATLTFAPVLIVVLYNRSFLGAASLLEWMCLGVALRVVLWPMGFILMAKQMNVAFMAAEVVWAFSNIALTWQLTPIMGLSGAGVAFLGSYVIHGLLVFAIANRATGFRWTPDNTRGIAVFACLAAGVFLAAQFLTYPLAIACGVPVIALSAWTSGSRLLAIAETALDPGPLRQIVVRLRRRFDWGAA